MSCIVCVLVEDRCTKLPAPFSFQWDGRLVCFFKFDLYYMEKKKKKLSAFRVLQVARDLFSECSVDREPMMTTL